MIDKNALRAIAATFGPPGEVRWNVDGENRAIVRAPDWDWEVARLPALPAVSSTFTGTLYRATPDVCTSGGAGLRSRWYAAVDGRVLDLQGTDPMRWFLSHHASWEDPAPLAELLEQRLDERSRSAVEELGLTEPDLTGDELTFYTWRIVMDSRDEAIEVERWILSRAGIAGPEWHFTRLPVLLRFGG